MQGLWLSSLPDLSRKQIDTAVALAKRYPDVIQPVIVGNEVLLRGEMSAPELARTIREVKAQVPMPVTYADVWEFWLRYREVAARRRFHHHSHPAVLGGLSRSRPQDAARHVDAIRRQVVDGLSGQGDPDRRIRLAERGPHARRRAAVAREPGARRCTRCWPLAKRANFRVNLIEAYDQPWKRQLEGTVGGHWGLLRRLSAQAEIRLGQRGLQPSGLALAGGRRRRACRVMIFGAAPARRAGCGRRLRLRAWLRYRRAIAVASGGADRLDVREGAARKPHRRRLDALAGLGGVSCWRSGCWRRGGCVGVAIPRFAALLGRRRTTARSAGARCLARS